MHIIIVFDERHREAFLILLLRELCARARLTRVEQIHVRQIASSLLSIVIRVEKFAQLQFDEQIRQDSLRRKAQS